MKSILDRVETMTMMERARALCQFNDWQWPDAFDDLKPKKWDELKEFSFNRAEATKFNNALQNEIRITLLKNCPDADRQWYFENVWMKSS